MLASDWAGTYVGTLPCADCEGIRTSLTIRADQTYTLVSDYLGREEYRFEEKGQFAWIKEGEVIELRGDDQRSLYRVGKNTLTMLNSDGETATGPMAEMYYLAGLRAGYPKAHRRKGDHLGAGTARQSQTIADGSPRYFGSPSDASLREGNHYRRRIHGGFGGEAGRFDR